MHGMFHSPLVSRRVKDFSPVPPRVSILRLSNIVTRLISNNASAPPSLFLPAQLRPKLSQVLEYSPCAATKISFYCVAFHCQEIRLDTPCSSHILVASKPHRLKLSAHLLMSNARKMHPFSLVTVILLVTSALAVPLPYTDAPDDATIRHAIASSNPQACNASAIADTTTASTATTTAIAGPRASGVCEGKNPKLGASKNQVWIYSGHFFRRRGRDLDPEQQSAVKASADSVVHAIEEKPMGGDQALRLRSAAEKGRIQSIKEHLLMARQDIVDAQPIGAEDVPDTLPDLINADSNLDDPAHRGPKFGSSESVPWIQGRRRRWSVI